MKKPTKIFVEYCIILLISTLHSYCFAQFVVSGKILNHDNAMPVVNVSVFLSNASVGGKTANDGTFTLQNIRPGKYELVASIVGFETYHQTVIVNDNDISLPHIIISPKSIVLNEVKVSSKIDPLRERNLDLFTEEFLGISDFAKECKILNPEILDLTFDETKNTLEASSSGFLEVENDALGYKLKYLLTNFIADYDNVQRNHMADRVILKAKKTHYEGFVLFEGLNGSAAELRRWLRRRQQVYEGSEMHFFRSVIANQIEEEGFKVLQVSVFQNPKRLPDSMINTKIKLYEKLKTENGRYKDSLSAWNKKLELPKIVRELMQFPLKNEEIAKLTNQKGVYALGCDNDGLYISYDADHHFSKNVSLAHLDNPDEGSTVLSFNTPYAFFDKNGLLIDPNSIALTGEWGKKRVAELLPVDYEPIQSKPAKPRPTVLPGPDTIQHNPLTDSLSKIILFANNNVKTRSRESLYLQLDKPNYAFGDTVWFKAYLFNALALGLSNMSKIMYVDLTNDSNTYVKQFRLQVKDGVAWGNIALDDFPAGKYTLRAYINWMRNFGQDAFFVKHFLIADVPKLTWLANCNFSSAVKDGKLQVNAKLQLSNADKSVVADKPVILELISKKGRGYKQMVHTDADGTVDINFKVPENIEKLSLIARDKDNINSIKIPVKLPVVESLDVQFLPEGGNLVAGLPAHVGFKAIGGDGRSVAISGVVTNQNGNQKKLFQSLYNGIGSFDLNIDADETYTAEIKLADGTKRAYPLPLVKTSGTVLSIINPAEQDSLKITVWATNDITRQHKNYFLIGKAHGLVCYTAVLNFNSNNFVSKKLAKSLFPSGITHFILNTETSQPLNERLVFINHNDNLQITANAGNGAYYPHDSVAVHIEVADNNESPVAGNFSMAVTDDAQVNPETLGNENIITRLLLTGELKGYVEDPAYYFETNDKKVCQALDNLLLTQGWVNFAWQEDKVHKAFEHEEQFEVKGHVTNGFNGAMKGTRVTLLSKSPLFVIDTLTDAKGDFLFRNFPLIDNPSFFLAVNKHDKSLNTQILVDDIKPPPFAANTGDITDSWPQYVDTLSLKTAKNNHLLKDEKYTTANGHLLKEVKITAKKVVTDSQNLNGPGEADMVLNEKDMIEADKKNWLDILQKRVKGFHQGNIRDFLKRCFILDKSMSDITSARVNSYPGMLFPWYFVDDKPIKFIIDGIPFGTDVKTGDLGAPNITDIQRFLESHTAEDIKGIELIKSIKYAGTYAVRYIPPDWPAFMNQLPWRISVNSSDYCFIEITTRSGKGPFNVENSPGTYLFKPLALSQPAQFYKPRYVVNDTSKYQPDFRSVIDWEPNIVLDKNGKATVSFYAADKPGTYTYIIEGTDRNASLGYKIGKIIIRDAKSQ